MEKLRNILELDLDGELDFITTDQIRLEEGNLGIPVALIPKLYMEALEIFKSSRKDDMQQSLCTKILLLLNPECLTFWNCRRRLIQKGILTSSSEYKFTTFLLTKHASKGRIWDYRLWLLKNYNIPSIENTDLKISNITADRYKCNYPSWSFRRLQILSRLQSEQEYAAELDESKAFIKRHISDSSGWSYRQAIVLAQKPVFLHSEVEWTVELIKFYPKHESIWNHLRFLCFYSSDKVLIRSCIDFASGLLATEHLNYPVVFLSAISRGLGIDLQIPHSSKLDKECR
jgi:Protein prenyltransferase alpha subunit repeat